MTDGDRLQRARRALLERIEALVGPGAIERFEEALTHASYANEASAPDNERLEFLGDAVLGLCVSELLAAAHATADEGRLTRMRSALVNADALALWARRVDLGACIALGRGATLGAEREQTNVLADAAEAIVAAVYEARGMPGARALVSDIVGPRLAEADALATPDPKSALQEQVQASGMPAPTYRVVDLKGSPHDQVFEVEVLLGEHAIARGEGRSKRLAERSAAATALESLRDDKNRKSS
ncbi:MAG: ribonuclease III [Polyangiaceae bacterium]|jgi:ribonuclease-3